MVEFENGLCIGNHLKAQNGLQRVLTIPGTLPGAFAHTIPPRQTKFQSAGVEQGTGFDS